LQGADPVPVHRAFQAAFQAAAFQAAFQAAAVHGAVPADRCPG